MISQAESFAHIAAAAAISAAMIGVGLGVVGPAAYRRVRARWPWLVGGGLGATAAVSLALFELDFRNLESAVLWVALGVIAGLIVAGLLLRVGLRGRYVGDHPHCRRCGFDLFGKPAESVVCNECGADLAAPRATVVGVRQRRALPLLAGAFVAIVALAIGASVARTMAASGGRFSAAQLKPNGWLTSAAFSAGGDEDVQELMRRLQANALSAADIRAALASAERSTARGGYGGGDHRAWQLAYAGWARGAIDEPTMRGYVRRAAELRLLLADKSLPTRVPYELEPASPFFVWGGRGAIAWTFVASDRVDTINGQAVPADAVVRTIPDRWGWQRGLGLDLGNLYRLLTPLPPGLATVELRMTMTVTLTATGRPSLTEVVPVVARGQTTIVPGFVRVLSDDGGDDTGRPGVADPTLSSVVATITPNANGREVTIAVGASASHHYFVGDAFARDAGGKEWPLGAVYFELGDRFTVAAAALPPGPFSLVFRPAPERGTDLFSDPSTYQHEFVIDAARVTRAPPNAPPR